MEVTAPSQNIENFTPVKRVAIQLYISITIQMATLGVNQDLAKWGKDTNESSPTLRAPPGGEIPDDRWLSEWAAYRHNFGCPTPEGVPYLSPPREQDCLETSIKALTNRFQYDTLKLWGDRGSKVISYTYISDDAGSAEKLCSFFEEKCKDDYEKTCSLMALTQGSRVVNIFKISNIVNHDLNNINVFIGGHGNRSGLVVEKSANIEGMEIINQSWQISHVRINTLPANATRFLFVQSNSPLSEKDISIESSLTNKFGVSTLRKIALTSFIITLALLFININATPVSWEEKQLGTLKSIDESIINTSANETKVIKDELNSVKSKISETESNLTDKLIELKEANNKLKRDAEKRRAP